MNLSDLPNYVKHQNLTFSGIADKSTANPHWGPVAFSLIGLSQILKFTSSLKSCQSAKFDIQASRIIHTPSSSSGLSQTCSMAAHELVDSIKHQVTCQGGEMHLFDFFMPPCILARISSMMACHYMPWNKQQITKEQPSKTGKQDPARK